MRHFIVLIVLQLFFYNSALSETYHISGLGNDTHEGSFDQPWRTFQYGIANLKPGDELLVMDGDYDGFAVNISGTEFNRIEIKSIGNARIVSPITYQNRLASIHVVGENITLSGFEVVGIGNGDRGIRISSGVAEDYLSGIIIRDCIVRSTGHEGISASYVQGILLEKNDVSYSDITHGIYVANSGDAPILRGNIVHNNEKAGIQLNADIELPGDHIISNAIIENNVFYGNNSYGNGGALTIASVRDSVIRNNLFYNNHKTGIAMWDDGFGEQWGSKNNEIVNNTIVIPSSSSKHGISLRNGSVNTVIRNNILIHQGSGDSYSVDPESFSGLDSDYNIVSRFEDVDGSIITLESWQSKYDLDLNSSIKTVDELFVNFENNNMSLKRDSGAIDSADSNYAPQIDFYGESRFDVIAIPNSGIGNIPFADIGAIEFLVEIKQPTPPIINSIN